MHTPRTARCSLAIVVALTACTDSSGPGDLPEPSEPLLAGGAGDQSASAVAMDGAAVYLSGPGILARFDATTGTLDWTVTRSGANHAAVAASGGHSFVAGWGTAGRSGAPGVCGATDDVGDIEVKTITAVHDGAGSEVDCRSQVWFPYSGYELFYAATSSGGHFFAGGFAQQSGFNGNPLALARYTSDGTFDAAVSEPDLTLGTSDGCCTGDSRVFGLGTIGSDLLVAGFSRLTGNGEDSEERPVVMRYTTALARVWKARSSDRIGRFLDASEAGGAVYAVGEARLPADTVPLVEKYDASGGRAWSVTYPELAALRGIIGVSGRIFAVGSVSEGEHGGSDAVVVELAPADGSVLTTTYLGGEENDGAVGVVSDGTVLWVAGNTRSYASDAGNGAGEQDLALWRVPLP